MSDIVESLKYYLIDHNLTQFDFAVMIGAAPQSVHRWINRKAKISKAYRAVFRIKGIFLEDTPASK